MSAPATKSPSRLRLFRFSYDEHQWLDDDDDPQDVMLKAAREQPWEPKEELTQAEAELHRDEDILTLDDLEERVCATLVNEWDLPREAVQIPLRRLAELMQREGYRFVGGSFLEFEGNHNDTEIEVVLEKLD